MSDPIARMEIEKAREEARAASTITRLLRQIVERSPDCEFGCHYCGEQSDDLDILDIPHRPRCEWANARDYLKHIEN